jgi:Kef-type K+ transport system membrane component KefB
LDLNPEDLISMFRKVTIISLFSSLAFLALGYFVGIGFGFKPGESLVIGAAMMFSSTIIGLKLLPTTVLHHQRTGEVMIGVLLMQDVIAILVLMGLDIAAVDGMSMTKIAYTSISLPLLLIFGFVFERYVLSKMFRRFDKVKEYIFLVAIGWCVGMAQLAATVGLPEEIGAFIAGVSIATGPIAIYIADSLKPLRDFFLVMFFFSVGASFDFHYIHTIWIPALILTAMAVLFKPLLFSFLLRRSGENKAVSWEVGVRLGQSSEFALIIAALAVSTMPSLISYNAEFLIEAVTIISFIISSYWVVLRYPTPLGFTEKMRRD